MSTAFGMQDIFILLCMGEEEGPNLLGSELGCRVEIALSDSLRGGAEFGSRRITVARGVHNNHAQTADSQLLKKVLHEVELDFAHGARQSLTVASESGRSKGKICDCLYRSLQLSFFLKQIPFIVFRVDEI